MLRLNKKTILYMRQLYIPEHEHHDEKLILKLH